MSRPSNGRRKHQRLQLQSLQHLREVGDEGLEQPRDSSENTAVSKVGGAESGAVGARRGILDTDLAAVVVAWPNLPEATRQKIVDLVRVSYTLDRLDGGKTENVL